jgi:hypothetical protein
MPISMAVAGPVGDSVGIALAFLIAGLVPTVLAVGTLLIARLGSDEREHPLDEFEQHNEETAEAAADPA